MNTAHLKSYAPRARKDFIAAVTARAAKFGITARHIEPIIEQGDVALIGDKAYPRAVAENRRKLEARIEHKGFARVMEAMAYTWFNRFMAIRYMELHGYLDHGRRILSHPEKQRAFEILEACTEVELPGVDKERVVELKLDGSKDEELYRLLLLGQCHALHQAMPFLFEAIEDDSELLLPDNLTKTDSLIRHLVDDIPEDNWDNIEIIGWLYQFYISEKKDQVIGKVVKSEDIPTATQLFTPNWIVKYMVQNSLGAQWLATYPNSKLKGQMEYYIEPAEQTDEVKAQLAAITPSQLNPEELTLIDPACGSGHILVEAYELFKAVYLERGYRQRDVPQLVLEKNLFGLEICPRASQLTGFALMMKGRAEDRQLFEKSIKLNVLALKDSTGFDPESLAKGIKLADYGLKLSDLTELKQLFEHATTFGSLVQVPERLAGKLPALKQLIEASSEDLFVSEALQRLGPLVQQAEMLSAQHNAVVANPPYLGLKNQALALKQYLRERYEGYDKDLFAAFIARGLALLQDDGRLGFMTPIAWMFLPTHEALRAHLISREIITSLLQLEESSFQAATVPICTFALRHMVDLGYRGTYVRLSDFRGSREQAPKTLEAITDKDCVWRYVAQQRDFRSIPGSPVSYWATRAFRLAFAQGVSFEDVATPRQGLGTGDNSRFTRRWYEVVHSSICFDAGNAAEALESGRTWFPYNKGGGYRKWFGNDSTVVNWKNDGAQIRQALIGKNPNIPRSEREYFRKGITWGLISGASFSARATPQGAIFDVGGSKAFPTEHDYFSSLGLLNSKLVVAFIELINPTVNSQVGDLKKIPVIDLGRQREKVSENVREIVTAAKSDWNAFEVAWDFQLLPVLTASTELTPTLESSYAAWITQNRDTIAEMKRLEEENNRLFIDAYGLADELTPEVPIEQITLTVNPAFRYGAKLTEEERWIRFRQDTCEELVSYAIGCIMGRYSLDAPGLIYAHSGNEGFDPSRYPTFPADSDGIVPITDTDWFPDDAAHRVIEFFSVAWDKSQLEANLTFVADNLSPKKNESSRETLRRYLCDSFFKNHLQTYKKRPIYWLFSSGKQKAFQCLVYLHRYNEGTLARVRTEYVIPLQGKMSSRVDQLDNDIAGTSSTAHRKKLEKERDKLAKQRVELQGFDEMLRHYADQRISLDLDDGVKVNYGKFGDLLAEVIVVTGSSAS